MERDGARAPRFGRHHRLSESTARRPAVVPVVEAGISDTIPVVVGIHPRDRYMGGATARSGFTLPAVKITDGEGWSREGDGQEHSAEMGRGIYLVVARAPQHPATAA